MDPRYDLSARRRCPSPWLAHCRMPAWRGVLAAFCFTASGPLAAQAPAGDASVVRELQRQQERERVQREQAEQEPEVHLPSPVPRVQDDGLPEGESPCVRIDRIELVGDEAARFPWLVRAASRRGDGAPDPVAGRCLGTVGVDAVMRRMQAALVARGFVTSRVLASPQDLSDGVLRLVLVPGHVHGIRFSDDSDARAPVTRALPVSTGNLLNLRDIEQALENMRRVPTAQAQVDITPAEPVAGESSAQAGDSDLVVRWTQSAPVRLVLSADDSGTRATGRRQGAATVLLDAPLRLNDLLSVTVQHDLGGGEGGDRGTRGQVVSYSLPWGYWLFGFNASHSRYHQTVAGDVVDYVYSGTSSQADMRVTRTLHRNALRKTTLTLRGWTRKSSNFIDDTEMVSQRRRTAGWELGASQRELASAAAMDFGLTYRRGTGAWEALPAREDAIGEGASRPGILSADASVMAPFTAGSQRIRWSTALRAQWSRTALVPQDRFTIGGRYTVRGFDGENVLAAQRGWLLRNELAWIAEGAGGIEAFAGLDHGEVSGAGADQLAGRRLTGAVLGLRGALGPVGYEVFIGRPLRKPDRFHTAGHVAGFSATATF